MDFIQSFIDFAVKHNCTPAEGENIIADDVRHYYRMAGDKIGSKKCGYQLKIDGNFAVGWISNYKLGETHTFVNKVNGTHLPQLTPEQKHDLKLKIDKEKELKKQELIKIRQEAAAEARDIWNNSLKDGNHPYLEKKKCNLNGCRIYGNKLVIPIYIEGKLASIQTIDNEGDKFFLKGGEIAGGYYPIATKDENKDILIICEGFATADALRKSLNRPIIIAFNANNIIEVAKVIRAKYPRSKVVIGADNDAYTEIPKGTLKNIGVIKAQQAAASIGGCQVIIPDILDDKNTDWNDIFCARGEFYTSSQFDIALIEEVEPTKPVLVVNNDSDDIPSYFDEIPPLEAYDEEEVKTVTLYTAGEKPEDPNWKEKLFYKENQSGETKLVAKHLGNCRIFLEFDPTLSNLFCYDEFSHEKLLYRCPPWEDPKKFKIRTLSDEDITSLTLALERRGIIQPFNIVSRLLTSLIKENPRNPAKEYFNNLKWDGVKRLDNWLIDYCGATHDEETYVQAIGRKWLCAAVARVLHPGIKFDSMLILEGKQNAGKSLILRELATINGRAYFNDSIRISDINSDRNVMKLQGVIIIELAELSSFARMSDEEIKAIISSPENIATLKYQNEAKNFPRQFVLGGTTNSVNTGYLRDATGNRRFWCVRVADRLQIERLREDKEKIWAEAVEVYKAGEKLYLEGELYKKATEVQQERMGHHPWTEDIEGLIIGRNKVSEKEIWEKLGITDRTKRTGRAAADISDIMMNLRFKKDKLRFGGHPERCWVREGNPVIETEIPVDDMEREGMESIYGN